MPEGPEVRTIADKLRPKLFNNFIIGGYLGERGQSKGFSNLKYPIKIIGVRSHGKKLLIDIDSGHMIIFSLGMGGRIQYDKGNHSHIRFDIAEGKNNGSFHILSYSFSLYFDDKRYQGGVDIIPNYNIHTYFGDIGPDLLQAAISEETWIPLNKWIDIFSRKKYQNRTIYNILKEQSTVSGIGNYLCSEILYYSAVSPLRIVSSLSHEEWDRIRINSHKIILLSYSYGGLTIESFISPDGSLGNYPAAVYGKKYDPNGNLVISEKIKGNQKSHWVPAIQH